MIAAEKVEVKLGSFTEVCRKLQQRSRRLRNLYGAKLHPASECYSPLEFMPWHFITLA
ncbi:hypothetical protein H6F67_03420 [Microcoleus sp. FACHB-1515]|uniref:hypothetical protein n=1 Tax=Cyanophyceae TaxID=3028117 RepID=UPI0016825BFF|nr:hypothetical protein [Microcoleus sp. FACHB-1515]MBD2088900.1 hypothetical protein [Microcoleus sp. FACHB-1515]